MKQTLHLLFTLCGLFWIVQSGKGEDFGKPLLIKENRSWNTRISSPAMPAYHTERTRITFLQGDTLIGETSYQKAYRSYYKDKSQAAYTGCLRQEGDRVFIVGKDRNEEVLLYDFGLREGDSFAFDSSFDNADFSFAGTVTSIDSIAIEGLKHKRIRFDNSEYGAWIEGIGSTDDILTHYSWNLDGYSGHLLLCCYDENGEKLYQNAITQETFTQKPQDNMIGIGTKWTDKWGSRLTGTGGEASYYIEGDTLVNSELYWKVNLEGWGKYNPFVLMREDRDSTIYIHFLYDYEEIYEIMWETHEGPDFFSPPEPHKDHLLYSFGNWEIGQRIPYIKYGNLDTLQITSIGTMQLADGLNYKTIDYRIIQTVGSGEGIFNPYTQHPTNGTMFHLEEYYRKGVSLYRANSISETKDNIRITQPAKGTVAFRAPDSAGSQMITLSDISGKPFRKVETDSSGETEISNLRQGIYLYEISGNKELKGKIAVW